MILRDVIFAEQRKTLIESVKQPVVTSAAAQRVAMVRAEPAPVAKIEPEPLNVERVIGWLIAQDGRTRDEIAEVLADDLNDLRAAAAQEGLAACRAEAQQAVHIEFDSALKALHAAASEAEAAFAAQKAELNKFCAQVVSIALAKLIGPSLAHPQASFEAVQQAVEQICGARELTIRVNVRDLAVIKSRESEIAEIFGGQHFTLTEDPRVSTGGCLLESSFGEVDARWETQLAAMVDTLRESFSE